MCRILDHKKIKIVLFKDNSAKQIFKKDSHKIKKVHLDAAVKYILQSITKDKIMFQQVTIVITRERPCLTYIHSDLKDQTAIFHRHSLYKTVLLKTFLEWKV